MVKIFFSTLKIAIATFLSRILGLVRELIMASMFGASGVTDAFLVAYRIPNMLRDLLAEGSFSSSFVPIFTEVSAKSKIDARKLLWSTFILLLFITLIITVMMMIFAPELIKLFAPKFYLDTVKFEITVNLLRLMSPFIVLVSLSALFMGVLNTLKIFFVPSLAPAFFNVIMILSMIFLPPWLQKFGIETVYSLGIGVVAGGLIQLAIQIPLIFTRGYGPVFPDQFISNYTKKIVNRLGIGTIGIAATQINVLINTILASSTLVGAVSWLSYSFRLFQFPVGILSVSIANSNLVHFSDAWKKEEYDDAYSFLKSSYYFSFLVIIPAMILLYIFSYDIVQILFEHGKFTEVDTQNTTVCMRLYLLGLPFYGLYKLFSPIFYIIDRPQIPVIISVIAILFNIIFGISLVPIYGYKVLALGVGLSMFINVTTQMIILKRVISLPVDLFINLRLGKVFISGAICFIFVNYLATQIGVESSSLVLQILDIFWMSFIAIILYIFCLLILGEWKNLKEFVVCFSNKR